MKNAPQRTEQNPHILRALAVLRAGLGIKPAEPPAPAVAAPVATAKAPAKPRQAKAKATASKAPPPARDIWFYLTKGKA